MFGNVREVFFKMLLLLSFRNDSSSANSDSQWSIVQWSITLNSKRSDLLILLCELVKINLGFLTESNTPIHEFCKIISLGCSLSIFSFKNLLRDYWTASLQKAQQTLKLFCSFTGHFSQQRANICLFGVYMNISYF